MHHKEVMIPLLISNVANKGNKHAKLLSLHLQALPKLMCLLQSHSRQGCVVWTL